MPEVDAHSPEIARARELDAAGRHDDAINQLATAAQRGDVEATTELAKRMIVGDRAPRLPRQGIELLKDAIKLGGAEAADRLAVVFAAGVAGPPDWGSAVRLLALAAERGWDPARGQLDVLASQREGESTGSAIHEDPQVRSFPAFVDPSVCAWLIERARGRLTRALVYDVVTQSDYADDSRTNSFAVFNLMEADLVHLLVQTRMSAACGQPVSHMEASTVLHYAVGERIGNHYDFIDPAKPGYAENIRRFGHRVMTFLVYLSSDYDGGETVFPKLGLSHSGKHGEGLLFVNTLGDGQADVRTLHSGHAPTRGEKWVFSQFIRNRPDRLAE